MKRIVHYHDDGAPCESCDAGITDRWNSGRKWLPPAAWDEESPL